MATPTSKEIVEQVIDEHVEDLMGSFEYTAFGKQELKDFLTKVVYKVEDEIHKQVLTLQS
jgi:hypothetical protein